MSKEVKCSFPKEAQVMAAMLKDLGLQEYEPGVVNQMLEFTYKYLTQVLDDARSFANYARKAKQIDIEDVKLAIHMQVEKSFSTPPPRDLLLELARNRNANPLPSIKSQCGVRLPADRYCLSSCNFRMKASGKKTSRSSANRGVKIENGAIKPSISMVTTKSGNSQNVTLVQKPSGSASATPAQKVVSVNRPVIKVTPGPPGGPVPKIHIASNSTLKAIKQEEPELSNKRKREDDD